MDTCTMYFCLKLKERHKEYNSENKPVKFAEFLRLLQYSKEDIDLIFDTMKNASKLHLEKKLDKDKLIQKIKSTIPMLYLHKKLRKMHLGEFRCGRWHWEKNVVFNQYDNLQLVQLLKEIRN